MTRTKTVCLVCSQRFLPGYHWDPQIVVSFYSLVFFRPVFARLHILVFILYSLLEGRGTVGGMVGDDPWLRGSCYVSPRNAILTPWHLDYTVYCVWCRNWHWLQFSFFFPASSSTKCRSFVLFGFFVCVYLGTAYYKETTSEQLFWFILLLGLAVIIIIIIIIILRLNARRQGC